MTINPELLKNLFRSFTQNSGKVYSKSEIYFPFVGKHCWEDLLFWCIQKCVHKYFKYFRKSIEKYTEKVSPYFKRDKFRHYYPWDSSDLYQSLDPKLIECMNTWTTVRKISKPFHSFFICFQSLRIMSSFCVQTTFCLITSSQNYFRNTFVKNHS